MFWLVIVVTMIRARVGSVVIVMATVAQGAIARADETGSAAALFQNGLQAMQANHYAEACPALAESYWLDPRPGVLFTLAECEAKWGRVASALAHYEDYLRLYDAMPAGQQAVQHERAAIARRQKAALPDRVPTITLILPPAAPPGAVVRRDDVVLGAPSIGVALPIDPGDHVVAVEIPGGGRASRAVTVAPGDRLRVDLPLPAQPAAAPVPVSAPVRSGDSPVAIALLVGGGAAIAAGAATGALAIADKSRITAHCAGTVCDAEGKAAADRGKRLGWASTVSFGAGVAAIAAGAAVWLFKPGHEAPRAASLGPSAWSIDGATAVGLAGRM